MKRYRFSRTLAAVVVVLGLLAAAVGALFAIGMLVVSTFAFAPSIAVVTSVPFLFVFAAGIMFALFGCMARAFFDIAEAKVRTSGDPRARQAEEAV